MEEETKKENALVKVSDVSLNAIDQITTTLGFPREIFPSKDEIETALKNLPSVISKIPSELCDEGIVKMCVAVSVGLFDGAINYAWNTAIKELRNKIKRFGLNVVAQVSGRIDFDEKRLFELKDAELIELSLQLNLITEDGYFFLNQCRDTRNNFSAAHPVIGQIDNHEFVAFFNRCAKYALSNDSNPVGVDVRAFIEAVKGVKFSTEQLNEWATRFRKTHEAQKELLIGTLHGIYCDPSSGEESRHNALSFTMELKDELSPRIKSLLIDQHQDYRGKNEERHRASQNFFTSLGFLTLLSEAERHSLISNACKNLLRVHQAFDNFYNEPPFAERLYQISTQGAIPETAKEEFVLVTVTCAVGNEYGISNMAYPYYKTIIANFSPAEIKILFDLLKKKTVLGYRIKGYQRCKDAFKTVLRLLNEESIPTSVRSTYEIYVK